MNIPQFFLFNIDSLAWWSPRLSQSKLFIPCLATIWQCTMEELVPRLKHNYPGKTPPLRGDNTIFSFFFFPVHKNFIKQNNIHWLWGMYVIPRFAHKLSSFQLPLPSLGFLSLKHKLQCPGNCPTFRCLWHTNSMLTCSLKSLQCRKGPVNATNIREITKILKFQRVFEGVFSGQGEVWIPIFLSVSPILLVYIDALSRYLPKEHGHWRDMNRDLNVGSITKSAMDAGK